MGKHYNPPVADRPPCPVCGVPAMSPAGNIDGRQRWRCATKVRTGRQGCGYQTFYPAEGHVRLRRGRYASTAPPPLADRPPCPVCGVAAMSTAGIHGGRQRWRCTTMIRSGRQGCGYQTIYPYARVRGVRGTALNYHTEMTDRQEKYLKRRALLAQKIMRKRNRLRMAYGADAVKPNAYTR